MISQWIYRFTALR